MEITRDFADRPKPSRGLLYYLRCRWRHYPSWVNIEVTKRCNARCLFCSYWEEAPREELKDYAPIVKKFRPVVVSLSGGEPLIRRDLEAVIRNFRPFCHYTALVTNGVLLGEDRADSLYKAGVNQISVSLDFLDERHDAIRGVPGLSARIKDIVPRLAEKGLNIVLNTIIMETNLDQIIPLAHQAVAWGAGISYSSYCGLKKGDFSHMISKGYLEQLDDIVGELKLLKRREGGVRNSDYYLNRIPLFFRNGGIPGCKAGIKWVQIAPDGAVQPCSELGAVCYYPEYDPSNIGRVNCTKCWFACRGEAEANPLNPRRLWELMKA